MDYSELAAELLENMHLLRKVMPKTKLSESMRGLMFILLFISHCDNDVLPGEISSEMDVSSARVAAALNSLENKGLITREIDKSDRRRIIVKLTQKGKEITEKHERELFSDVEHVLGQLGEHDAREFIRIIARLAAVAANRIEPV